MKILKNVFAIAGVAAIPVLLYFLLFSPKSKFWEQPGDLKYDVIIIDQETLAKQEVIFLHSIYHGSDIDISATGWNDHTGQDYGWVEFDDKLLRTDGTEVAIPNAVAPSIYFIDSKTFAAIPKLGSIKLTPSPRLGVLPNTPSFVQYKVEAFDTGGIDITKDLPPELTLLNPSPPAKPGIQ